MKARLAIYAAGNLVSGVASLLSVLVLARLLPPERYGEYVTVLVVAALCQAGGFSWLQSSIIRLHGEETDKDGRTRFAALRRASGAASGFYPCSAKCRNGNQRKRWLAASA
jgi:O-antigen/teichoic acid export membrane protein